MSQAGQGAGGDGEAYALADGVVQGGADEQRKAEIEHSEDQAQEEQTTKAELHQAGASPARPRLQRCSSDERPCQHETS
jgi:hypothetical protein